MVAAWHFSRIDTLELKSQIEKKLGRLKAEKYFDLLTKFLNLKVSKPDFDRLCTATLGRENVHLHNYLLRAILRNACLSKTAPLKDSKARGPLSVKVPYSYQRSSLQTLCRDFPLSPRKGRTPNIRDRKFKDRPKPLGPLGKSHGSVFEELTPKYHEHQSATELFSLGSRPPGSVEDGEEVDQAAGSPGIHSRSPVRAPLGIPISTKSARKVPWNNRSESSFRIETCHDTGELPDTSSLWRKLEQKLSMDGMNVSVDSINVLNVGLDVYLKRLIKPCLDLASTRSGQRPMLQRQVPPVPVGYVQQPSGLIYSSMSDFRVVMELNPSILGEEWPMQLEKVCLRASEE